MRFVGLATALTGLLLATVGATREARPAPERPVIEGDNPFAGVTGVLVDVPSYPPELEDRLPAHDLEAGITQLLRKAGIPVLGNDALPAAPVFNIAVESTAPCTGNAFHVTVRVFQVVQPLHNHGVKLIAQTAGNDATVSASEPDHAAAVRSAVLRNVQALIDVYRIAEVRDHSAANK